MKLRKPDSSDPCRLDPVERQKLLLDNLVEVESVSRQLHRQLRARVAFDDLFQEGVVGLIDAIDKFDTRKNVKLRTYARFRIRGAILDSLRRLDWCPRNLRRKARLLERLSHQLIGELGCAPSEFELAARLEIPLAEYHRLRTDLGGLKLESLQSSLEDGNEGDWPPLTLLPDQTPLEISLRMESYQLLESAQLGLSARSRQVLRMYYVDELTMGTIGKILGINESRVSQIHSSLLSNLRSRLALLMRPAALEDSGHGHPPSQDRPDRNSRFCPAQNSAISRRTRKESAAQNNDLRRSFAASDRIMAFEHCSR